MLANSAQHRFGIIPEVTYGITPAVTPAFQLLPITGTTLALTKGMIESEIIRSDRQIADVRHGNRQVGGEISTELMYGGFDLFLQAVLGGTWAADQLFPGVVRRSFSMLRHFTDLTGGSMKAYHMFTGVELNTFSLTVAPEAMVKATFGAIGKNWALSDTPPTGATFIGENANKPFDGFTGTININGSPIANITELQLTLENGMEPRFVVFQDTTNQPKIGKTRITGSMTCYFDSPIMLLAFNGGEKMTLAFTLTDLLGNDYNFAFDEILVNGGQADVQGDGDITLPIQFSAIFSQDVGTAMFVQRVPV